VSQLGTYNPIANKDGIKEVRLDVDRIKYWLSVGAQPSDKVAWLLGKADILPMPPVRHKPTNMVPKKERTAEFSTCATAPDTCIYMPIPSIEEILALHSSSSSSSRE
jgi:ribosomal protein S16